MAESSDIEWCDSTHNHWYGCEAISPACAHCYAEAWARRYGHDFAKRTLTSQANRRKPLKWNREHAEFFVLHGRRRRVFCCSLADVFDNKVDPLWRSDLFGLIRDTPHLDWLVLTKRIGNVRHMLPDDWGDGYKNVWLGATIANQEEADRDIVKLLRIPAFVHFLSCEPLLGPIRFDRRHAHCSVHDYEGGFCTGPCPHLVLVDWVIVGGESGPKARHMPEEWARSIRDQCDSAGISFFMKQMTKKAPIPTDLLMRDFPKVAA